MRHLSLLVIHCQLEGHRLLQHTPLSYLLHYYPLPFPLHCLSGQGGTEPSPGNEWDGQGRPNAKESRILFEAHHSQLVRAMSIETTKDFPFLSPSLLLITEHLLFSSFLSRFLLLCWLAYCTSNYHVPLAIYSHLLSYTATWSYRAKEVLRDLKSVVKSTDAAETYAMGFGLGFRVMGVKAGKSYQFHRMWTLIYNL